MLDCYLTREEETFIDEYGDDETYITYFLKLGKDDEWFRIPYDRVEKYREFEKEGLVKLHWV